MSKVSIGEVRRPELPTCSFSLCQAKRAVQRGATAVIFDVSENPEAIDQVNSSHANPAISLKEALPLVNLSGEVSCLYLDIIPEGGELRGVKSQGVGVGNIFKDSSGPAAWTANLTASTSLSCPFGDPEAVLPKNFKDFQIQISSPSLAVLFLLSPGPCTG